MRRSLASALAFAASAVLLIGCARTTSAAPTTSPSSAPSSPAESTPPEAEPQIVVSLDGISVTDDSGTSSADYDDSTALLELLEKTTGELPEPEAIPGADSTLQSFRWDGLWVLTDSAGEVPASITVTGPAIDDIPITTEEGFAVGSTRADLLAADAWTLVESEDPAAAPYLGLGGREVPGTESLTKPGSVGILYVLFPLEGDAVTQIQVPSNDFGDV